MLIENFILSWQQKIATALTKGQSLGSVKKEIKVDEVARFIILIIEGAFGQAKSSQDKNEFIKFGNQLEHYLGTLAV